MRASENGLDAGVKTESPRKAGSQTDIGEVIEEIRPDLDVMGPPTNTTK